MRAVLHHGQQPKPNVYYHDTGYGELYVPQAGVTYSDPRVAQYFGERRSDEFKGAIVPEPWLQSETQAVIDSTEENPVTVITGDLGAGKSTVLFGSRTMLREAKEPYVLINGHYLDKGNLAVAAVRRATQQGQTVIYDSTDYLFMRNNKRRLAKKVRPQAKEAINEHIEEGGRIIMTSHTDPWFGANSTPELQAEMDEWLTDLGATVHRVHGLLDDTALGDMGTRIHGNEYAEAFTPLARNSKEPTARTFRIVKLMGAQLPLRDIQSFSQDEFDRAVQAIDAETRRRMNAAPDYSLLPMDS